MKNFSLLVAALAIALASVWAHDRLIGSSAQSAQESAYDRVMRTKTLRCGRGDWPPITFYKDLKTGELSGIMHDVTEEVGKRLGLKIDWSEDTGWVNIVSSLQTRRIDAFCAGMWVNAERGRYLTYSQPIFFNSVFPFVRAQDHRFDADVTLANDPGVRIAVIDGEMTDTIAREHFSKAKKVSVGQMLQVSEALNNVAMNKADIVVTDYGFGTDFIKSNPGTLRRLGDKPFQVFQASYGYDIHETALRDMIDNALTEMHNQGIIAKIIAKYSRDPRAIVPVSSAYRQ